MAFTLSSLISLLHVLSALWFNSFDSMMRCAIAAKVKRDQFGLLSGTIVLLKHKCLIIV